MQPSTLVTGPAITRVLRVPCPYCGQGGVNIAIANTGLDEQVRSLIEPRQCDHSACKRFFRMSVKVSVSGVKLNNGEN